MTCHGIRSFDSLRRNLASGPIGGRICDGEVVSQTFMLQLFILTLKCIFIVRLPVR